MDSHLLHLANILYLASYSVRDILWLRVLTVIAMLCLGWCYLSCIPPAMTAVWWQVAFLSINFYQIGLLLYERRPVQLTESQKEMHAGPLKTLTPRQVQRFTQKAQWCNLEKGEQLLAENSQLEHLILLLSGEASVIAQGKQIAKLEGGQFAGEMSFLTRGNTTARVVADGPVLVAKWPEQYVSELMRRDQELGSALQAALGVDLVKKLVHSRQRD